MNQQNGNNRLAGYVEVNVRIQQFYDKYPEGSIQTEILKWEDGVVVMKAYAYRTPDDVRPATGHAYEKEGSSQVNRTSALENCETSAVGRALALLGFEIKKSIASKEEVENAIHQQEQPEKPERKKIAPAREDQMKSIATAKKALGLSTEELTQLAINIGVKDVRNMNTGEANLLIEALADYKPQEAANA